MIEDNNEPITTLKGLRNSFGLTQKQMGKLIGVSEATILNYEKGKTFPNSYVIKRIENVFGVNYRMISFSPKLHLNSNYASLLT